MILKKVTMFVAVDGYSRSKPRGFQRFCAPNPLVEATRSIARLG
ncbi:hypothetical protein GGQ65_000552 [Rhizobium fabae]|uniref:Uncharacterized protein n=1 Tax=Rhizobium fabae TaxID=573179 RepID=A0A7W6FGV0_9HYPH|nr:hypothetical protein [Rhizobium fabae]